MKKGLTVEELMASKRGCEANIQRTVEHLLAAFHAETGVAMDGVTLDVGMSDITQEPGVYSATINLNLD